MGEEKRQFVRWKDRIQVSYSSEVEKQRIKYRKVFTEDISETGILISTLEVLKFGRYIDLRLEFVYDSVPILVTAKVVHAKRSGDQWNVGLEFVKFDDFGKQRFMRFLEFIREEHDQKGE